MSTLARRRVRARKTKWQGPTQHATGRHGDPSSFDYETGRGGLRRLLFGDGWVGPSRQRPNIPAGFAVALWFFAIALPVYYIVITSFRRQDEYLTKGALDLPSKLTLDNYRSLIDIGFDRFVVNSVIVAAATVMLALGTALPAAYVIVRNTSRPVQLVFSVALFGFAIPAQAVIVPIYLIITRMDLYDSLVAIVLPTAAFAIPISIIVLTSTLRDIPNDLYEAMVVDGAGSVRTFVRLVVPLARPGMVTVAIFSGLSAWNGFMFPLVLTQSPDQQVLPLGLANFQGQYGINVPGLMAAVVVSALPVLALYLGFRRSMVSGLTAGFGK